MATVLNQTNLTETEINSKMNTPNGNEFQMLRSLDDSEVPWLAFIIGQTPSSIWYWCTDQVIVQRTLAAKDLSHSQDGALLAGFLKFIPPLLMVFPGIIARILYPTELNCIKGEHCQSVCGEEVSCANMAFPMLVLRLLPTGLRGLMFSVVIAALMSGLDSIFNSAATLFTIDIWNLLKPNSTQEVQVRVGRIVVIVLTVIGVAWIPIIKSQGSGNLFYYMIEVNNHISPQIAAVFILAVIWPRTSEAGAFFGCLAGFILGFARLILVFIYHGAEKQPSILGRFLHSRCIMISDQAISN